MLFLTQLQAIQLRGKIFRGLQHDSYVEFDARFIKPIFGGTADLRRWCELWNLEHDIFIRAGLLRADRKTPIEWVSIKYQEPEQIVIL